MATKEDTAQYWVDKLGLESHPFLKGYFKETFRDEYQVPGGSTDMPGERAASSLIYFLHVPQSPLSDSTIFFRMQSCVAAHYYCGKPISIYWLPEEHSDKMEKVVLGPNPELDQVFHFVCPKNKWFTRILEEEQISTADEEEKEESTTNTQESPEDINLSNCNFTLAGVTVAPGFDFNDLRTANYAAVLETVTK